MDRSSPASERYFWIHKVEKLIFFFSLAGCHDVDFWAQGMLCGAFLSLTPAWFQGEVRRVPEKLALLFLIHLPSWCKHFGGAHQSPSGPPAVSARGGG